MPLSIKQVPTGSALPTLEMLLDASPSSERLALLDVTSWAVFVALYRYIQRSWSSPSQKTIAAVAHIADVSTVRRAVRRLESAGLIEVVTESLADGTTRNSYHLGHEALRELADIARRSR